MTLLEQEVQTTDNITWENIVKTAKAWGYGGGAVMAMPELWHSKRVMDVGMGGGPHCVGFIENGAKFYAGVDPMVTTDHVRDFRNPADPSIPAYHAFDYTPAQIMEICPNIKLINGFLEDNIDVLKPLNLEVAILSAVSEHLRYPDKVIEGIWNALADDGVLFMSHCNYYSWTGHHRAPRSVKQLDENNPNHLAVIDWKHLETDHPDYNNVNFNRIRLADFKVLISKYFEIFDWKITVEGLDRLTPAIREKYRKYSLEELLAQNIYISARKRAEPLDIDLSDRQFFHPAENYKIENDYLHEDIKPWELVNTVYFSNKNFAYSHSDNNSAGLKFFLTLSPGDKVKFKKFDKQYIFTVDEVVNNEGETPKLKLKEELPPQILERGYNQMWSSTKA